MIQRTADGETGTGDGVFAVLGSKMEALVSQIASEIINFSADAENV